MKTEFKTPKNGAGQRLRELYKKLRDETRRSEVDKAKKPSLPDKKIAQPSNDPDLDI